MNESQRNQSVFTLLLPIVVDVVTAVGLLTAVPPLASRLAAPSGSNALLLVAIYILFLIGTLLLRKLTPITPGAPWPAWLPPQARAILAILFGLAMMTALAYQLGYFQVFMVAGPEIINEGASSALFVFAPGAWLFLAMFYVFVLAFPVRPTIAATGARYVGAYGVGLTAVNSLLLFATAQLKASIPAHGLVWVIPIYILLWLLFSPPRLLEAHRQGSWRNLISFDLLLLFCAWVVCAP
ncbi:MAG: hypothetical protein IAE79_28535 [Anaerolinea sp.]|nr:hypothetical protein [Anaerolinea sp.]